MWDDRLDGNSLVDDITEVLITTEELQARVTELGAQISTDYAGKDPLLVGVLRGVFVFMADLVRAITIPIGVDFIGITSYGSPTQTQSVVRFTKDLETCVKGRHVLFVEDVVDTGLSLRYTCAASKPVNLPASGSARCSTNRGRVSLIWTLPTLASCCPTSSSSAMAWTTTNDTVTCRLWAC